MLGGGRLHGEAVLPLCLWCAKPDQECYVPSMHSTVQSSTAAGITRTHCEASSVTLAAAALTQPVVTRLHVVVPFAFDAGPQSSHWGLHIHCQCKALQQVS